MIPEEARKIARDNGFQEFASGQKDPDGVMKACLLYKEFWQALGKGMGWDVEVNLQGETHDDFLLADDYEWKGCGMKKYIFKWHNLVDYLAEGGTIDTFFAKF
jgi:hypothetical protein